MIIQDLVTSRNICRLRHVGGVCLSDIQVGIILTGDTWDKNEGWISWGCLGRVMETVNVRIERELFSISEPRG